MSNTHPNPEPVQLHHSLVMHGEGQPKRWMLMLHGILGSGGNWRSFARQLAAAAPSWGFVLVDLRGHGHSPGGHAPYTLQACARDLDALCRSLAEKHSVDVSAVMGHSFGAKVAMQFAIGRRDAAQLLEHLWVLDASPSARSAPAPSSSSLSPGEARRAGTETILAMLRSLPSKLSSREAYVLAIRDAAEARELVLSDGLVQWLAMNVRREGDQFSYGVDLDLIEALLADYFRQDLWDGLEHAAAELTQVVIGGRSDAMNAADLSRLSEARATNPGLYVHTLERAGHWLHVDDPVGLQEVLANRLVSR